MLPVRRAEAAFPSVTAPMSSKLGRVGIRHVASMLLWCAAIAVSTGTALRAEPQERADGTVPSLTRLKDRLEKPPAPRLAPKEPVALRPTFRTRVIDRPFVPTLDEHLRETFALTDFQRQYARYAAMCCGVDLGALFRGIDHAMTERRERKVREHVSRELAEVEAARAPHVR